MQTGTRRAAIVTGVLASALTLAAAAGAAKPKHGARFDGHTAAGLVVGFHAPVSFKVSGDGRSLSKFTFGSLGCFGAGGFRPGVNPYTGSSLIDAGTVKVSAAGRISVTGAKATSTSFGNTWVTTVAISGHFSTPKTASGTITFSQTISGKFTSSCGPASIGFTASAH